MKKIHDIDICNRLGLLIKLVPDRYHSSWDFLAGALFCHTYCYLVSISQQEVSQLLLNAALQKTAIQLPLSELPTLEEVMNYIKATPSFLEDHGQYSALFSERVKEDYDQLGQGSNLSPSVVQDSMDTMRKGKPYYVIDGMHRLVAYALWTDLAPESFPISVYLCTNEQVKTLMANN